MRAKAILLGLAALAIGSATFTYASDLTPLDLRLNWEPGDHFRYRCHLEAKCREGTTEVTNFFNLRVLENSPNPGESGVAEHTRSCAEAVNSLAIAERTLAVELSYGTAEFTLPTPAGKLHVTVEPQAIEAKLRGRALPESQMRLLRRELKQVQTMLSCPVQLRMTDRGKVTSVSGLASMDAESQRDLARALLEGLMLPDRPLAIGECYRESRSLQALLPPQPGNSADRGADQDVEIVRTLKRIHHDKHGRLVAEFVAPIEFSADNIVLDESGTRASLDCDMSYETEYHVASGTILRESGKGKMRVKLKGSASDTVDFTVAATVELLDREQNDALTAHLEGSGR